MLPKDRKTAGYPAEVEHIMFGITTSVLLTIAAMLIVVGGLVGFWFVLRRRAGDSGTVASAAVPDQTRRTLMARLFDFDSQPHEPNSPTLIRLLPIVPLVSSTLFGLGVGLGSHNWIIGAAAVVGLLLFQVAVYAQLQKAGYVLTKLNEGYAIIVFSIGRLYKVHFVLGNHISMNRKWAKIADQSEGDIVDIDKTVQKLREKRDRQINSSATPPEKPVTDLDISRFEKWARERERSMNCYGGLRFVGWPPIHQILKYSYRAFGYTRAVNKNGVWVTEKTVESKEGQKLIPLTVVVKSFILSSLETMAPRSATDSENSNAIPVDTELQVFLIGINPAKAIIRTQSEGWSAILEPRLVPLVNEIFRDTPVDQLFNLQPQMAERLMMELGGQKARWDAPDYVGIKMPVVDDQRQGSNRISLLQTEYGLLVLEAHFMWVDPTRVADKEQLQANAMAALVGRALVTKEDYEARANILRGKGEANRLNQVMDAVERNPEFAKTDRMARAIEGSKGSVIVNVGDGRGVGAGEAWIGEQVRNSGGGSSAVSTTKKGRAEAKPVDATETAKDGEKKEA